MYAPTHPQVRFETLKGAVVTVDEGMYDVLETMKEMGIETQYSCQQNIASAYVCSRSKGHLRIVLRVLFLYLTRRYSPASRVVAKKFIHGLKSWQIGHYQQKGYIERFTYKLVVNNNLHDHQYKYEWSASIKYGVRTTLRWASADTEAVNAFLQETLA